MCFPLVLRREALWERFERTKLKSPEQLPDLQEEEIDLVWDTENAGGKKRETASCGVSPCFGSAGPASMR